MSGSTSQDVHETDRINLLNELRGKGTEERRLDSSPSTAVVPRTCEDTIRALKKFRRSVRLSIAQHNLAKDYFSHRQFYFFILPVAIFALESSVFSFSSYTYYIADAEQEQYVGLSFLAVLTAVFSMGIVVLQAINRECQYKERSVLHDASVDNLKCLELELDRALGELFSDNEFRERIDWMVRAVLVKQFKDIEQGCKSELPPYIRNAYRLLERDMESLYRHCHGSSGSYSTSFDDFHKTAFDILFQEIRMRRLFTCTLPHPSRVKQKTLSTLFQNERYLEAEATLWEKEQRKHKEEEKLLLRQLEEAEANGRATKMGRRNNTGEDKDESKRQHEEEVIFYKEEEDQTMDARIDSPV